MPVMWSLARSRDDGSSLPARSSSTTGLAQPRDIFNGMLPLQIRRPTELVWSRADRRSVRPCNARAWGLGTRELSSAVYI
jgi:hypothetical protein